MLKFDYFLLSVRQAESKKTHTRGVNPLISFISRFKGLRGFSRAILSRASEKIFFPCRLCGEADPCCETITLQ
jgi:hypothetical protein